MHKYTSFDDFEVDGKIDWDALYKARKENGEICSQCKSFLLSPKGKPSICYNCESLTKDDKVDHSSFIRCPNCKKLISPEDHELFYLFNEGEHEVNCPGCGNDFSVSTTVKYTFESPELNE